MNVFYSYVKKYDLDIAVGLVLVTMLVYARVIWHDFLNYDDPFIVTMNANILNGFNAASLRWAFTTSLEGNWIPLSWLSHILDIELFGLNPAGHHFMNVLWHCASTLLLFLFLNKTTGERRKSAMVAFLFALHPLHVESVAWVAERKDVLSGFFWMLTLYCYADYASKGCFIRYFLCLATFVLGLLAKPMLVTLPLILLLVDFWPLKRFENSASRIDFAKLPRLVYEKIPFVLLAIAVSFITYLTQKSDGAVSENYTMLSRAGKAITYYVAYLGKLMWPTGLSVFYPRSFYPPSVMHIAGAALFLAAVTLFAFIVMKRHSYILMGWFWYLITLVPVIGFIQIGSHSIADRYTYIPFIGVFTVFVWGGAALANRFGMAGMPLCIFSALLIIANITVTYIQLGYWKNSITLFSHAVEVTESNHVALTNLGNALLETGRFEESIYYLQLAVKERPADTFALMNMGNAYRRMNEHEKALESYSRVLLLEPGSEKGHYEIGVQYIVMGQQNNSVNEYNILKQMDSKFAPKLLKQIIKKPSIN